MTKCTNNHTGPLNIGGVTIAPNGGEAVLDATQLKTAKASNAVKVWEELELISFEKEKSEPKKKAPAKKAGASKEPVAPTAPAVPGVPSAS